MLDSLRILFLFSVPGFLIGCGGGNSSAPVDQVGGMTILVGDGPLEDVNEVNIDIGRMVLIGDEGQIELTDDATDGSINLLDLRNITALLLDVEDVPAGNYTKVRMYIDSLEIAGEDVVDGPFSDFAQLPANGKIDLLARGGFEISPGEDLVVEIDFDLEHSVHIVATGNSEYRFRPVVFIDVVDLRLTRLFGTAQDVAEDDTAFVLCEGETPCDCEAPENSCVSVNAAGALTLPGAGLAEYDLMEGDPVHVFGLFNVGVTDESTVFDAAAIVQGAEDTVVKIDGDVLLNGEGGIATIDARTIIAVDGDLVLDRQGNPVDAADGDAAESWAQIDPMAADLPDPFPSFLTLVTPAEDEDGIEGSLASIDGDRLNLLTDDMDEFCVIVDGTTEIQNIDGFDTDATTGLMELSSLLALDPETGSIEVGAFGTFQEGITPACLEADLIVVETDAD